MKDNDEKNIRGAEDDIDVVSKSEAESTGESNINFIMCNEYGVDLEKIKVPLLESSKENSCDEDDSVLSACEISDWDDDYEDRHTVTLLILGIIIALIMSYCAMLTFRVNKIEKTLMANHINISSKSSDVLATDIEIDVLEKILVSKIADYGYSSDLMAVIYYIDNLSNEDIQPYELFNKLSKAIDTANISLIDTEYDVFAHVLNNKIYEFINDNRLSEKEAARVAVMLQRVLNDSLNRF